MYLDFEQIIAHSSPCNRAFFTRDDVVLIAQELVGKLLVVRHENVALVERIVETEAYRGADDKGCHSFIHGLTDRTAVMFEEGGCAYVYICYGMHQMLNVVTNVKGQGDAVLIRAVAPVLGLDKMKAWRHWQGKTVNYQLSGGPGKVGQLLGIDKRWNGTSFVEEGSPMQIRDDGYEGALTQTPRVGMSSRVADYANKPWRFYIAGHPCVSRPLNLRYDY